jgi:hypothetical protein
MDKCEMCGAPSHGWQFCDDCMFATEPRNLWVRSMTWFVAIGLVIIALLFVLRGCAGAQTLGFRNPVTIVGVKSSCADVLLGVQLADAATTREILGRGGYERDPLARPFVRSSFGAFAAVAVTNTVARILTYRRPSLMCVGAGVESIAVVNNVRVLRAMK